MVGATVHGIDLDRRAVHMAALEGEAYELPYDQLVLALGAMTNEEVIPGSESAFTFKTLADAVVLRNHLIERFERADVEADPGRKRRLLTIVVIGGGLVGVELFGELTAFGAEASGVYRHGGRAGVRFVLPPPARAVGGGCCPDAGVLDGRRPRRRPACQRPTR